MLNEFTALLREQEANHSIYVWGGQGEQYPIITEEWIRRREDSETNANRAIAFWKKRCKAGYRLILRAFDCSGLGIWAMQQLGLVGGDMSADTLMRNCKMIDKDELLCGDWAFRVDKRGNAYHIGYIVNDALEVIEAKGRDDGVLLKKVDGNGRHYWNRFGRPKWFEEEIEARKPAPVRRELRYKTIGHMKGADVKEAQALLVKQGLSVGGCGIDGDFGKDTDAAVRKVQKAHSLKIDGIIGTNTWAKLLGK